MLYDVCDLDFDPNTLYLNELDIMVTTYYTKEEINRSFVSKVIVWKHRQTDRQTDRHTHRHTHTHTHTHTHRQTYKVFGQWLSRTI